jgi:hypothetical protein
MASSSDPNAASVEDTQKAAAVDGSSQHADMGRVRVEDNKLQDGKKKKKPKSKAAKKRGTGFEGKFPYPTMSLHLCRLAHPCQSTTATRP